MTLQNHLTQLLGGILWIALRIIGTNTNRRNSLREKFSREFNQLGQNMNHIGTVTAEEND
jgi:hypothetical protein